MYNNSNEVLQSLQSFRASRRKPDQILSESRTRLGVPTSTQRLSGLRAAVSNSEELLKGVDPSVRGRTSGVNATEAQRARLIALEREPITETLTTQQSGLTQEQANLENLMQQSAQEAQLAFGNDDNKQKELEGIYSMLYQRERDAEAKAERDRAFAAQQAEAARQTAASRASSGGAGGYFSAGRAVSAPAAPAKSWVGNDDFRGRLAFLAANGNGDARVALKYSGNNARYDGVVNSVEELAALKRVGIQGNYYIAGTQQRNSVPGLTVVRGNVNGLRF